MNIGTLILTALYFMLPAYFANMAPVFVRKIPLLKQPLDFGKSIGGRRIFGDHKTIRGIAAGVIFGTALFAVQSWLYRFPLFQSISLIDYDQFFTSYSVVPGALLGAGAVAGDAVKSFFKRRADIQPGRPWIPFDQIDFIIGAIVFILPLHVLSWEVIISLLIATPVLHIATNHAGYYLKIRKVKW